MRKSLFQLARFGVIGCLATIIHYTVAVGVALLSGPYTANATGYVSAVLVSYLGHQRFTFQVPTQARSHSRHFPRFIAASLFALLCSQLVLAATGSFDIDEQVRLALAVLIVPPVSYLLNRFWVYG